jgi:hypothetical protein
LVAQFHDSKTNTSLGDHSTEEQAAHAYDRFMIKMGNEGTGKLNFPIEYYAAEIEDLKSTQHCFVSQLR